MERLRDHLMKEGCSTTLEKKPRAEFKTLIDQGLKQPRPNPTSRRTPLRNWTTALHPEHHKDCKKHPMEASVN